MASTFLILLETAGDEKEKNQMIVTFQIILKILVIKIVKPNVTFLILLSKFGQSSSVIYLNIFKF